jgi:RimJ/RimL family protein N-acetyltransferase
MKISEGVQLAPILPKHAEQLFAYRNDEAVWRWCRQNTLLEWNNHLRWINSLGSDASIKMFAIEFAEPDRETELLGVCGFTDISWVNQRAEFSLYVAPKHRRRCIGSDSLKRLFFHGFDDLNLNTIWGETFDGNPALGIFLGLGMVKEGTRKEFYFRNGRFIDAHLVSIGRKKWHSLHS